MESRLITLNTTGPRNLDKLLETGLSAASPHGIQQRAELAVLQGISALKRYAASGVTIFIGVFE
jgi:hypothetical protein